MIITRKSFVSGLTRSIDLPITPEQMKRYNEGALVQDAFPHLSASDREFIQSGLTDEDWDTLLSDEDDHPDQEEEYRRTAYEDMLDG